MSLGSDQAVCSDRLKGGMHDVLEQQKPDSGQNVERPEVKPSFDGLGWGLFRILTIDAEVVTSPAFGQWVSQLGTWVANMQAWQQGMKAAFNAWTPTSAADTALRTAVLALADPVPPGSAPPPFLGKVK
jgi:hypothetical protein